MSNWTKNLKKSVAAATEKAAIASKNTKEQISIQKKQMMIADRKKAFGVEYMDLVMSDAANPEQLEDCVHRARNEIETLMGKVAKYAGRIALNQEKLEQKLAPATSPSITVTDAEPSASESDPPAAAAAAAAVPAVASAPPAPNPFDEDDMEDLKAKPPPYASASATPPFAVASRTSNSGSAEAPSARAANPFGDDDDEEVGQRPTPNPFDDDEEEMGQRSATNPFDDDDDEEEATTVRPNPTRARISTATNPFDENDDEEITLVEAQAVPHGAALTPGVVVMPLRDDKFSDC